MFEIYCIFREKIYPIARKIILSVLKRSIIIMKRKSQYRDKSEDKLQN